MLTELFRFVLRGDRRSEVRSDVDSRLHPTPLNTTKKVGGSVLVNIGGTKPPVAPPRYRGSSGSHVSVVRLGGDDSIEDFLNGVDSTASLHSSRHSLLGDNKFPLVDHEPVVGEAPGLNHTAARHKIAIRPRRTHALPRTRRPLQVQSSSVLPTTLEVSEEGAYASRSVSASHIQQFDPLNYHPDPHHLHKQQVGGERSNSSRDSPERREESSIFPRLMESVRSGRRRSRSRHSADREVDRSSPRRSTEHPSSDLPAGGEMKAGKFLPLIGRSNSRGKQMQDQMKSKAWSAEGRKLERDEMEKRAASVEGRIEGKLDNHQDRSRAHQLNFEDHNNASVKKAKSFRETGKPIAVVRRESSSRRSWFGKDTQVDFSSDTPAGRLSSSYDNLDDRASAMSNRRGSAEQTAAPVIDKEPKKHAPSKPLSPTSALSSTDSLTTTEIPGVYIRPLSQYKKHTVSDLNKEFQFYPGPRKRDVNESVLSFQSTHRQISCPSNITDSFMNSGPLSLDSSLSSYPDEESQNIQKSNSSGHVIPCNDSNFSDSVYPYPSHNISTSVYTNRESCRKSLPATGTSVTEIVMSDESKVPPSTPGPASVLRSLSLSTSDTSGNYGVLNRRASSADELEGREQHPPIAPARPSLRKRESSLSRNSSQDSTVAVPEFLRIQLNKVEDKPQRVVYDTEVASSRDSINDVVERRPESRTQTSIDLDEMISECKSSVPDKIRRESTMSSVSVSSQSSITDSCDEVVLRRPLRREKSLVMEANPNTKKEEEPELLKVFARRSFKVKDSFTLSQEDPLDQLEREVPNELAPSSLSSQMTGVTKINPLYSTPTPPRTPVISSFNENKFNISESQRSSKDYSLSSSPPMDISRELEGAFVETVSGNVAVVTTKAPPLQTQMKRPSFTCVSPNLCNINPASPVTKTDTKTEQTATSEVPTQEVSIRPMTASKEPTISILQPFTSSANASHVSSVIFNRSQPQQSLANTSASTEPQPVETSLSTVSIVSEPVSSNVWPSKSNLKASAHKSSLFTPKVRSEPLKPFVQKNVENPGSETTVKSEENIPPETVEEEESQVRSVRRKFMAGTPKPFNTSSVTPMTASITPSPITTCVKTSTTNSLPVIEARNIVPAFTVTVRSNTSTSTATSRIGSPSIHPPSRSNSTVCSSAVVVPSPVSHHRHSIGGLYVPHPRQQLPGSASPSPSPPSSYRRSISHAPSSETSSPVPSAVITQRPSVKPSSGGVSTEFAEGEGEGTGDDWRALVRQRREDRLKMNKPVDTAEQSGDNRNSRSSKVLEMASNFQKLQVA